MEKEKLLLHACCAPCSPYAIELLSKSFIPTVYFYNPNIYPEKEHTLRQLELEGYVRSLGLDFIAEKYEAKKWTQAVKGLEVEPEGGLRCEVCFRLRLNKIALCAKEHGFKIFTTTLTVSPHKNASLINRLGERYAASYGLSFLNYDFKKNDGFKKSCQKSHELGFYRQDYCGCLYSKIESEERRNVRRNLPDLALR